MMVCTTEDARALLQTTRAVHVERHGATTFTPGTHLPVEPAAERLGIGPGSLRYGAAIEVPKEDEGAIEQDEVHIFETCATIIRRASLYL